MKTTAPQQYFNACSTGKPTLVEKYLFEGVDPEARDTNHLTGLIWSGRKGHVEIARILLAHGADVNAGDIRNRTALFHAVTYKRYEYVDYIAAKGANLNILDSHGWTALDFAISSQSSKMVEHLKRLGATSGKQDASPSVEATNCSKLQFAPHLER